MCIAIEQIPVALQQRLSKSRKKALKAGFQTLMSY
jgi:hypothetical protein